MSGFVNAFLGVIEKSTRQRKITTMRFLATFDEQDVELRRAQCENDEVNSEQKRWW